MKHAIHRIIPGETPEDPFTTEATGEEFEELPAPEPTLGGRLLALFNETGVEHVALPIAEPTAP